MSYAPILVSVYNRVTHFKRCIASLQSNPEAIDSELYIVSDGASKEADVQAINEIRRFSQNLNGFKKVTLIARESNYGFFESIVQAYEDIICKYDQIIFLEDDLEVSKCFLTFLNDGLTTFNDDEKVYSICSYCPPPACSEKLARNIMVGPFHCPWGFGTWKSRCKKIDMKRNTEAYNEVTSNKPLRNLLARHSPHMLETLYQDCIEQRLDAVDVRISCQMMLKGMYSIYPSLSLCRNNGLDGTGLHMGVDDQMLYQKICDDYFVDSWRPTYDEVFYESLLEYGNRSHKMMFYSFIHYLNMRSYIKPLLGICKSLKRGIIRG